jgi:hypothetical protein
MKVIILAVPHLVEVNIVTCSISQVKVGSFSLSLLLQRDDENSSLHPR